MYVNNPLLLFKYYLNFKVNFQKLLNLNEINYFSFNYIYEPSTVEERHSFF